MPAVFEQAYVKRLDGPHVKRGKNKMELAGQLRETSAVSKKPATWPEWSWSGAAARRFTSTRAGAPILGGLRKRPGGERPCYRP